MNEPAKELTAEVETGAALNPPLPAAALHQGVTRDEVRHVAALASLELTQAEEANMERDLNAILGYVAELSGLDTTAVEPMAQVSEILPGRVAATSSAGLRADEPRASLLRLTVMANAPATDGTFFKVPKVIER